MSEHEACPFCGGHNLYLDGDFNSERVACNDCAAEGPIALARVFKTESAEELQAVAWALWDSRGRDKDD